MLFKKNTKEIDRASLKVGVLLLFSLVLPLFPSAEKPASYNVNFAILIFSSLFFLGVFKLGYLRLITVFVFFIPFQLALFLSAIFSLEGVGVNISYIISVFRPVYLFFLFSIFLGCMVSIKTDADLDNFLYKIRYYVALMAALGVFLALIEVFLGITNIQGVLYKRSALLSLENYITTFFSTSYHSGFFFFSLLVFAIPIFSYKSKFFQFLIWMAIGLVAILSQSKPIVLSTFIILAYFVFFKNSRLKLVVPVFIFSFLAFFSIIKQISLYIAEYFYDDSIAARGIVRILDKSEESGTLSVRVQQIFESIDFVSNNYFIIGAGMGQGIYLESWPAEIIYRYGFIVFPYVFFLYAYALFCLAKTSVSYKNKNYIRLSFLSKALFFWVLFLPLTQFSGLMVEEGKLSVISMFLMALVVKLIVVSKITLKEV